jgi:phosphate transport system substrate-binding protein
MKKLLALLSALLTFATLVAADTVNGAGASFPFPIYSQWAFDYNKLTGMQLNYQSIGSGGGIAQIKAKTVDFGASDEPLKEEDLNAAGLFQFPMVIGGVVPVINVKGIEPGKLQLSGETLAQIFLGAIAKWNDPKIAADNPGIALPDQKIVVVHRSDGSGTTWIFTNYLTKASADWSAKVGNAKAVNWPVGVGGKGNEGVAAFVKQTGGSIGYVEYAYALKNKMNYTKLKNKAGKFVAPSIDTFQSAAANADWQNAKGFYMVLTDQPGDRSWPIVGASYILIYKAMPDAAKAQTMMKFFDWCFKNGDKTAKSLDYVPLPKPLIDLVQTKWKSELKASGQPVWK